MEDGGRFLALEAQILELQRSLTTHDFLLRALVTHLALSEPEAFQRMVSGFARSGFYHSELTSAALTRDVANELGDFLDEIAASVAGRSDHI